MKHPVYSLYPSAVHGAGGHGSLNGEEFVDHPVYSLYPSAVHGTGGHGSLNGEESLWTTLFTVCIHQLYMVLMVMVV